MEGYIDRTFSAVKSKHTSEETLQKWRDVCGMVKNPKRRFRHTANLLKRSEAAAMRRTNQVLFSYYVYLLVFIVIRLKQSFLS